MRWLGIAALTCFAIHATYHLLSGRAPDLLWGCHVATVLVGLGALLERPVPVAVGVLWLCFGNPLWALDVTTGGEFLPTSLFTHVGGFVIGLLALRTLRFPARSWLYAAAGYLVLLGATRLLTPRASNVNLAFAVAPGWERTFPSYPAYLLLLMTAGTATFFVVSLVLRKVYA
jgi:hypothetical protein